MCISAIALGTVWMIVSPEPVTKQKAEAPEKRTLAYQQAIAQREEQKAEAETAAAPPSETLTEDADTGEEDPTAADAAAPQDMAALPGEDAPSQAPEPLPWAADHPEQRGYEQGGQDTAYGRPPADQYAPPAAGPLGQQPGAPSGRQDGYGPPPGGSYGQQDAYGAPQGDPYAARRDPYGQQDAYGAPQGDPYAARRDPYGQQQDAYAQPQDPYAQPRDPYAQQNPYGGQPAPYGQPQQGQYGGQPGEQWVQVIGSGTGMRATASIDAPILFAFPYGRQLKVVSRNDDWVEVSDPSTSAKGWMPAHALAPSAGPNAGYYGQQQTYEEQPQERPGLFRRGGFADMINRAFGGGN